MPFFFYWLYSIVQGIIGIILLIPPIISSFLFICEIYGLGGSISSLMRLSQYWLAIENGTSAPPIYLGLMAIACVFMVRFAVKDFIDVIKIAGRVESLEITEDKKQ